MFHVGNTQVVDCDETIECVILCRPFRGHYNCSKLSLCLLQRSDLVTASFTDTHTHGSVAAIAGDNLGAILSAVFHSLV